MCSHLSEDRIEQNVRMEVCRIRLRPQPINSLNQQDSVRSAIHLEKRKEMCNTVI